MSCSKQPDNAVLEPRDGRRAPTVLCIDDDPRVSEVIEDWLDAFEVKLLKAFFGTQGIWMAVTQSPDVIICDLRMPQADGSTVIECLKRNRRTAATPIIVLTALHEAALQRHLEKIGASSYLTKPIHFNDLLGELRQHIEIRPKRVEAR